MKYTFSKSEMWRRVPCEQPLNNESADAGLRVLNVGEDEKSMNKRVTRTSRRFCSTWPGCIIIWMIDRIALPVLN